MKANNTDNKKEISGPILSSAEESQTVSSNEMQTLPVKRNEASRGIATELGKTTIAKTNSYNFDSQSPENIVELIKKLEIELRSRDSYNTKMINLLQNEVNELKSNKTQQESVNAELQAKVKVLEKQAKNSETVQEDVKVLILNVKELKPDVKELKSDIKELKSGVEALKSDVEVLQSDVEVLQSDVEVLKRTVKQNAITLGRLFVSIYTENSLSNWTETQNAEVAKEKAIVQKEGLYKFFFKYLIGRQVYEQWIFPVLYTSLGFVSFILPFVGRLVTLSSGERSVIYHLWTGVVACRLVLNIVAELIDICQSGTQSFRIRRSRDIVNSIIELTYHLGVSDLPPGKTE